MFKGRGNAGGCAVTLYMGEGPRGSNGARSTPCHPQSNWGPFWCWFPSGWACAHSRPLWISPMTSPVRLGVSPAATPTPMGVFNQRFEALFPCAGALGCTVCFAPHRLSGLFMHECGAAGSATHCSACPTSATLSPALSVYLCANVGP